MGPSMEDFVLKYRNETRILAFYSPTNKKIKEFLNHYSAVAKKFVSEDIPVRLAKIDVTNPSNKEFFQKFEFKKTPGIVYFLENHDDPIYYKESYTYDDLVHSFYKKDKPRREDL